MNNKLKLTSEQQKQFDLIAMYNSNFLALLKPLSDLFAPSDIPELFKIYQMDLFQLFGVCSSDDVSIQETNAIKYIICELFPFSLDNFENMDNHGMTKLFRNYEGSDYCFSEPTVPKLLNILSLYCNAGETLSHVILSDVNGSIIMDYYRELLNSIGEFYLILSNNGSQEINVSQRKFIRYMKLVDEFIKQVKLPRNQKRLPPLESRGVFFPKSMEGLAISYDCIINRAEKVEIENVEVLESGNAKSINSIYGTLSVQFETDPRNNSLSYSLKVNIDNQLTHILTIKSGEQNDIHYDKNELKITIEKANIALVFSDEDELAANLNDLYIVFNYYNAKKLVDSYITKEGIMMNDSDFDICREEYAGEYIPSSAKELNDLYSQIFESGEEPTFTGMRINNVSVKYESVDSFVTFSGDIYFGFSDQPVVAQDFFNNPFEYPFGFYKMTSDGPKQFMSSS